MAKPLLDLIRQTEIPAIPPVWLMRQAGRYLPEYRRVRAEAGGFLDLCYSPELAEEVTLQPIQRYGFDASIVFADILLVPHALGQKLWFETGEGPRLEPISCASDLSLKGARAHLAPVSETLSRLTKSLPASTTLIGFAGAPWTVATYMVAGRGTPDQAPARELARTEPEKFQEIIDMLVDATVDYLAEQISAGADVVQLFESWAASLQGEAFDRWCVKPVQAIISGLRAKGLDTPVIGFPRGAQSPLENYVQQTRCDVLALDTNANRRDVSAACGPEVVLQGNLDPQILVAGGGELDAAIDAILEDFANRRFIFNLGHGILPETPPEHVAQLMARVRKAS
ncbi:MAG: uroporphyrinogen decarboxylase [Pseudomonadota bacterium]|nr:uroporphyrinogen decarboxylase [Pseudomonadota bacterium]